MKMPHDAIKLMLFYALTKQILHSIQNISNGQQCDTQHLYLH